MRHRLSIWHFSGYKLINYFYRVDRPTWKELFENKFWRNTIMKHFSNVQGNSLVPFSPQLCFLI